MTDCASFLQVRLQAQSGYKGILHCMSKTYCREGVRSFAASGPPPPHPPPPPTPLLPPCININNSKYLSVSLQLRGFFKGMAFPLLTTGLINSVTFGCYSNTLDYLTQSQRNGLARNEPASAAQVFAAGCFSGLIQVRSQLEQVS